MRTRAGLRAERVHTVFNGALECRLLRLQWFGGGREQMIHSDRSAKSTSVSPIPRRRCSAIAVAKNIKHSEVGAARTRELLPL